MAAQELRLRRMLRGGRELKRYADLPVERFYEEHWRPSRPVVLTDAMRAVPAVQRWSQEWLLSRYGELEVEVNVGRQVKTRKSLRERESATVTLASFLEDTRTGQSDERYIVSKNGLLARPELRELEADLRPLPDMLIPPKLPAGVSLWVGPAGTFSPAHFDPHGVLLTQVEGRKRVRLVSPDQLALLHRMDGFFARRSLDDPELHKSPDFDPDQVLDVTLAPGESLFIPAGWFHEVRALDRSMTLSFLCFRWPNHFHWLRAHSSE
jgi:ribosomal protein L16 Arg81 hydroxylase